MVQQYVNHSPDTPLETSFYFPVDIDFALSKILIDYEDLDQPGKITSIETVMEERKKAEQIYEDAVAEGDKTAVLAQTVSRKKKSLIRVNMGNFPPRSKATLTCVMYASTMSEGDLRTFRLPLCFIP
mmetsp:Transcript_643/g.747  ORF Transcript_643/g.747 Transcript_643/m.747 type:complete len:127 (+) Transcript_643:469-849(+)